MSAMITDEKATKVFDAVQALRDELPLITTIAATALPAAVPELALAEAILSKVFQAVVNLRAMHDAESAKPALAEATAAAGEALLNAK